MTSTEDLFNNSIIQYKSIIQLNNRLAEQIASLSLGDVLKKCETIQELQRNQSKTDSFIIEVMVDTGHAILDEPYVAEYQKLLMQAKKSCDEVAKKATDIQSMLKTDIKKLNHGQKGLAGYNSSVQGETNLDGCY